MTSPPAHLRQPSVTLALAAAAYVVLGLVGRATTIPGDVLALIWPAAGAAVVLVGLLPPRWWPAALAVLAVATFGFNYGTGVAPVTAAVFVVPNVLQGLTGALVLRRTTPDLVLAGGSGTLRDFRDHVALMVAAAASSAVAVVGGTAVLVQVTGSWSLDGVLVWWGRNTVGALVAMTLAVLVLGRDERPYDAVESDGATRGRRLELAALFTVTLVLYAAIFSDLTSIEHAFPLLVPTVWAGLRFGLRTVAVHAVLCLTIVVVATLRGVGSFADLGSSQETALVSQTYLALVFCLGFLLVLTSEERRELARTLRRAHDESSNQAQLLSTVVNSMREGVALLDDRGEAQVANPASWRLLGFEPGQAVGEDDVDFEVLDSAGRPLPVERQPLARALAGEVVCAADVSLVFADDRPPRYLSVSAQALPFPTAQGRAQAVVIYHDVTVERARRDALESFARTVAHDLKGPLGVVEGWSELMLDDAAGRDLIPATEVSSTAGRIRGAAVTMRELIRDLLESSLSRDQQLRIAEVDLRLLAEQVADQHRMLAEGTPPQIVLDEELPTVSADEPQVRQLLSNLIGNACKYVRPGETAEISVRARRVGAMVEIEVGDRGIGIPFGRHHDVFGVFSRAHADTGYEGHGIGLSVCKTIVGRHGGSIRARPRRSGPGTVFVFTLPAAGVAHGVPVAAR